MIPKTPHAAVLLVLMIATAIPFLWMLSAAAANETEASLRRSLSGFTYLLLPLLLYVLMRGRRRHHGGVSWITGRHRQDRPQTSPPKPPSS